MMKNDIVLANTQPTTTITAIAQQSNTKSVADQPTSAQSADTQPTVIQPVAAAQPDVVDANINPITVGLGAAVSAIKINEKPTVFVDTPVNQEQILRHCEQSNRGSSAANPDISPISNNAVKLLFSEHDRAQVVREIQCIEKRNSCHHTCFGHPSSTRRPSFIVASCIETRDR